MARAEMHMTTHLVLEAEKPTHINTVKASLGALRIHSSVHSMDLGSSSLHSPEDMYMKFEGQPGLLRLKGAGLCKLLPTWPASVPLTCKQMLSFA